MDWLLLLTSMLVPLVPLFFFPVCTCCAAPANDPDCVFCYDPTFPDEVTITYAGIVNDLGCAAFGGSDLCTDYNISVVLPKTGTCNYTLNVPTVVADCGASSFIQYGASLQGGSVGGTFQARATFVTTSGVFVLCQLSWTSANQPRGDCTGLVISCPISLNSTAGTNPCRSNGTSPVIYTM